ncbi:MAG: DNA topoisomerase IB [Actinomycetota bacterium]
MPRIRRVDCSGPGIKRKRHGRGFAYYTASGDRITDAVLIARVKALGIPPAWKDVWICPDADGHLQAVGTDAAGRRQYIYHEVWRQRQDQAKFDHMMDFAAMLPVVRAVTLEHLQLEGQPREKTLGLAVRLLDRGFFRIGSEGYAEENQSYGLATIQKRHVTIRDSEVVFDYRSKSGKRRIWSTVDPIMIEVIASLKRRRSGGLDLLVYKNGRLWSDIRSSDINEYVREISGGDFTAKDFRTWGATVLAAVGLAVSGNAAGSRTARKRAIARSVKEVAHYLGNTPAVCRASYIDPRVFDRYQSGWTISLDSIGEGAESGELATQGPIEEAVVDLIEDRRRSPALEKIA